MGSGTRKYHLKKLFAQKAWYHVANWMFEVAHAAADKIAKKHPLDYDPDVSFANLENLYIPFQVNHLHGQTEPVPRRMRATLTETEPVLFDVNYQTTVC